MLGKWMSAVILTVSFLFTTPAVLGQEKGAVRAGFSAESLSGQKILLFRPSVWVGEQSTGGMGEPNADWTAQARDFLNAELARRQIEFSNELIIEPDLVGEDAKLFSEHRALFNSVANSVVNYQFFAGNRLPTRKNKAFDWTLGEGTKEIAERTGARYGLFVRTEDQYGSFGRKMFQVLAIGLVGAGVSSGKHVGYAGLVDLHTGDLVWLNADEQMGGDVRTEEGMQKRVGQLLEDFPGLKPVAVAAK
ncbi:hypothetical protein SAMN05428974_3131 [Sphingopyxis sp. YR583]|uniref:hypothetical protein n=1 Tax=Sphingopyxis sp. YR583 TaxID=1881047 RepID=UPI0008A7624C|nr:hypothetical protein [Sphingopyxis sp. YR583]SEH18887.1 hypothetical protein SAMN05428974_3131 [Sphingopyxis sp. YR583]